MLRALEEMASTLISEQLQSMFESADDLLFEMSGKTKNSKEQSLFLETMRIVRMERPRMLKAFQESLHRAFTRSDLEAFGSGADLDNLESWTMQESSDLEEKIAISNLDSKAHSLFSSELYELEQRMSQVAQQSGGTISSAALAPSRIVEAFQRSMKGTDIEFPIKLVLYKLFDRTVISNLGNVFTGANQLLAEHGFQLRQTPRKEKAPHQVQPQPLPGFAGPTGDFQGPGALSPSFQGMARSLHPEYLSQAMQPYLQGGMPAIPGGYGAMPGTPGDQYPGVGNIVLPGHGMGLPGQGTHTASHDNAQLASEMLSVMEAVGHGQPIDSWMPAQNLALVSRMFNDLYSDPRLPEAARPTLGRMQFPVMKVAVGDPSFFSNPQHPVRSLVNDVFDAAAGVRGAQSADFHRLEQLVLDLLQRFDPDPSRLRQAARDTHPVTEEEAERFLQQQQQRALEQRSQIKEKTRRIVAQELRLHIGGRTLPKPLMTLLLSGFAPLLSAYYLRGGSESQDWKQSLELLDRLLTSFDANSLSAADRAESEAEIVASVSQRFFSAGLSDEKVHSLITGLVGSYLLLSLSPKGFSSKVPAAVEPAIVPEPPSPAVAPATTSMATPDIALPTPIPVQSVSAPAPAISLHGLPLLLKTGEWFKVWESGASHCRWLKLLNFFPARDLIVFEDFGAENFLKMKLSAFVQDLVTERSAPVNPDPAMQKLIKLLPAAVSGPIEAGASWFKNNPLAETRHG